MVQMGHLLMTCLAAILIQVSDAGSRWAEWWAYDEGISGPNFWGLLNPGWTLCNKGHNQSPVNIDPKTLLFDPSLSPLDIRGSAVSGVLMNRGHSLTMDVDMVSHWSGGVNITGGPLSYIYRMSKLSVHFSHSNYDGSEHTVSGKGFSAEIQLFGFNSDLYDNLTMAMSAPRGVVCIAILVKVADSIHPQFERIHRVLNDTLYKGEQRQITYLNLRQLLPLTEHYMTYEGSLTHPACQETVTWIIYNKPIYISTKQITGLRRLKQDTIYNPVLLMAGNIRPIQPLNQRTVRTNIDVANNGERVCSMKRDMNYMELLASKKPRPSARSAKVHSLRRQCRVIYSVHLIASDQVTVYIECFDWKMIFYIKMGSGLTHNVAG